MKIIWPFDPFNRDSKLDKIGKELILNYFSTDSLEAVYVASHSEVELANAFNIPRKYRFTLYPKKIIQKHLIRLNLKNTKIKVIESESFSKTKIVNELVTYADEKQVDVILLASNSKKIIPKFIFGSFAETFIHLSSTDLLIYNQKHTHNKKPAKLLYAHDFSNNANKGLLKAITYAQKWDATLYVLHVPVLTSELSDEENNFLIEARLKKCEKILQKMKIKFELISLVEDISMDDLSIDEIILNFARRHKIDLIAMTTQANNLRVLLGGSITRSVLRNSKKPVLVFKV